jgi:hypothetical protein
MTNLWMKTLRLCVCFRHRHTNLLEASIQPRRESGKAINDLSKRDFRYYYNWWYTPANTTELDYQIERIKKRKNQLSNSNQKNSTLKFLETFPNYRTKQKTFFQIKIRAQKNKSAKSAIG